VLLAPGLWTWTWSTNSSCEGVSCSLSPSAGALRRWWRGYGDTSARRTRFPPWLPGHGNPRNAAPLQPAPRGGGGREAPNAAGTPPASRRGKGRPEAEASAPRRPSPERGGWAASALAAGVKAGPERPARGESASGEPREQGQCPRPAPLLLLRRPLCSPLPAQPTPQHLSDKLQPGLSLLHGGVALLSYANEKTDRNAQTLTANT